ncbi:C39 family peptidase [Acholeplasma laidlawii]|uniref:C39 family peptidase n=1 Tax=Acholeplasma laidlawii TaxID=2148 RepID=UPI0015AE855A|nr:C39 family peptidase [Acholeplasma laidlawii]NWH11090.1 C39 family peptidase [Acholeplasma laidlawii]
MKRYVITILTILLSSLLTACSLGDSNTDEEITDEPVIEEPIEVKVDGTKTIYADELCYVKEEAAIINLSLDSNKSIVLEDAAQQATYESEPIEVNHFNELVLSWNVKNLEDARITFFIALGDGTDFGSYQIMGLFKDENHMSFNSLDDPYGRVSIDTLINKDPSKNNYIKLKFTVIAGSADQLEIKNISVTTKSVDSALTYDASKLTNKVIDVAPMQQLSIPNIGNVICSTTSVAMVLNHYGYTFTQQEMAKKVYDNSKGIYGNWTFNASYAGSLDGIAARVEYIEDFSVVIDYILNDIPVVFSISTTSADQLNGAIMAFPAGHLVVLKGFEEINGVWHGVFNDPAEYEDSKVERKYPMEQVLKVWRQYTYIIVKSETI